MTFEQWWQENRQRLPVDVLTQQICHLAFLGGRVSVAEEIGPIANRMMEVYDAQIALLKQENARLRSLFTAEVA